MKVQTIIGLFFVLLLSAIAVTTGITTTQILQPAYSQASHCTLPFFIHTCATPGQDPSTSSCLFSNCIVTPRSPQEVGKAIGEIHQDCSETQPHGDCFVQTPDR